MAYIPPSFSSFLKKNDLNISNSGMSTRQTKRIYSNGGMHVKYYSIRSENYTSKST